MTAREALERYRAMRQAGRLDEALQALERVLQAYPDEPALLWHRTDTLAALGRCAEALATAERLQELKPEDERVRAMRRQLSLRHDADQLLEATAPSRPSLRAPPPELGPEAVARLEAAYAETWQQARADVQQRPAAVAALALHRLAHPLPPRVEPCGPPSDPLARDQERSHAEQLRARGFEVLGWFRADHLAVPFAAAPVLRVYVHADAQTHAIACWLSAPAAQGWRARLRRLLEPIRPVAALEMVSFLHDGGCLITSNLGGQLPVSDDPALQHRRLRPGTSARVLWHVHRARLLDHVGEVVIDASLRGLTERLHAAERRRAAARRVGGPAPEELRRLLGRDHDRLAPRVLALMARLDAAVASV